MKTLLTLFVVCCCLSVFGQNALKVGAYFSRDFQHLPDRINAQDYVRYFNVESNETNITAGVSVEAGIAKRFSVRSGLMYSNKDYSASEYCVTCLMIAGSPMPTTTTTFRQRYLEVPVLARYYILKKRFSVFADAGVAASFLVENKIADAWLSEEELKSNRFLLNAEAGLGIGYTILRQIDIQIGGVYRNSLTTYMYSDDMQLRSVGVNVAIYYKIR